MVLRSLFFSWLTPLFKKGTRGQLSRSDLLFWEHDRHPEMLERWVADYAGDHPWAATRGMLAQYHPQVKAILGLGIFSYGLSILSPILFNLIIDRIASGRGDLPALAGIFVVVALLHPMANQHAIHRIFSLAIRIQGNLSRQILKAVLRGGQLSQSKGKVINVVDADLECFINSGLVNLNLAWMTPLQILSSSILVVYFLGLPGILGIALLLLLIPLSKRVVSGLSSRRKDYQSSCDERVNYTESLLKNHAAVKVLGIGALFKRRIEECRNRELLLLRKLSLSSNLWALSNHLIALLSMGCALATYLMVETDPSIATIITGIVVFSGLTQNLILAPSLVRQLSDARVSLRRILDFLAQPVSSQPERRVSGNSVTKFWDMIPEVESKFIWNLGEAEKESLIDNALAESPRVAFCPNEAHLLSGSIFQNVVFGEEPNEARFVAVVQSCALIHDFQGLADWEKYQIVNNGSNLSGGQKKRVMLARTAYQDADCYLFVDPFSSLDAATARHVYRELFLGILAGKRVLVLSTQPPLDLESVESSEARACTPNFKGNTTGDLLASKVSSEPEQAYGSGQKVIGRVDSESRESVWSKFRNERLDDSFVDPKAYWLYARAAGGVSAMFILVVLTIGSDVLKVLAHWTLSNFSATSEWLGSLEAVAMVFLFVTILSSVAQFLAGRFVYLRGILTSRKIHKSLLSGILEKDNLFESDQEADHLLQNFTKDLKTIDEQIPPIGFSLTKQVSAVLVGLSVMVLTVPAIIPVIVVLAGLIFDAQQKFRRTSRQIRRGEFGFHKSYLATVGELIDSAKYLRQSRSEGVALKIFSENNHRYLSAVFALLAANRWLTLRLELLGAVALSCLCLLGTWLPDGYDLPLFALSLTYALNLSNSLKLSVRTMTQLESKVQSVERVGKVMGSSVGSDRAIEPIQIFDRGIVLEDLSFRYPKAEQDTLVDVSLSIAPGRFVGISGRTGSGKSTLLLLIARLLSPLSGKISVGRVNLQEVDGESFRKIVSFIPQEPFLMPGTVRENFAHFSGVKDDRIIDALANSGFFDCFTSDPAKILERDVRGISAAEGQFIHLAQAICSRAMVVLMDEPTAYLSEKQEMEFLSRLRSSLGTTTIVMISHRVMALSHCDVEYSINNARVSRVL